MSRFALAPGPPANFSRPLKLTDPLSVVRLSLNKRVAVKTRDAVFFSVVLGALAHAGYVMSQDSTMGAGGGSTKKD